MNALLTREFAALVSCWRSHAILASEGRRLVRRHACHGVNGALFRGLMFLTLLLFPLQVSAQRRVVIVPFRCVDSFILVEARIDGRPITLLVDTGANKTILNAKSFGRVSPPVNKPVNQGAGIVGNALRLRVDLEIAHQILFSQPVSVMNLEELSKRCRIPFDGLLGQDILNQFRSVRFDYKSHVIELEI